MVTRWFLATIAWAAANIAWLADGMVVTGELPQKDSDSLVPEFAGKFCFDFDVRKQTDIGRVQLRVSVNEPAVGNKHDDAMHRQLWFLMFDDRHDRWPTARRRWFSSTCHDKWALASWARQINMTHALEGEAVMSVNVKEQRRPRFWYFAVVTCNNPNDTVSEPLPLRYSLHATNVRWGWQQEFSFDHTGVIPVYGSATLAFGMCLLLGWRLQRRCINMQQDQEQPYVQLVGLSVLASFVSCALFFLHYVRFAQDGVGWLHIRLLAVLAGIIANCTVFLVAMLCSVGWGITKGCMPNRQTFFGLITVVGALSAHCEFQAQTVIDESTRLYSFQSTAGILSLVVKIFMFCWFAYHIRATKTEEIDSRTLRFYRYFNVAFSSWALSVPTIVVLAFKIDPWYRCKVVTAVDLLTRFLGQALLVLLFCGPLSPVGTRSKSLLTETQAAVAGAVAGKTGTDRSDYPDLPVQV